MTTAPDHVIHGEDTIAAHGANNEIKGLLTEVIAKFSDADRRNESLLRDMHGQLESLRSQARDTRPNVPHQYQPGFERIEDGMALLAAKIAETYATRSASAPAHVHIDTIAQTAAVESPVPPQAYVPAAPPISHAFATLEPVEPEATGPGSQPPLRSSPAGLTSLPRFGKLSSHADTFDVIESVPGDPMEPWSPEDVAALSEIYTSRDIMFSMSGQPKEPAAAVVAGRDPVEQVLHAPRETAAPSFDQTWLENRFCEISKLIVEARPAPVAETAVAALGQRFATLEHHMSEILHGMARAEDFGGFAQIEHHIAELSAKVEQVQAEMARFDGLEHRLGQIEAGVAAVHSSGQSDQAAADLHAVAIAAAESAAGRVAQQIARDQQRLNGPDRLTDVHEMLASYMAERRHGDEQTSAILDTLQQAMVHLLDRVDARSGDHVTSQTDQPGQHQLPDYDGVEADAADHSGMFDAVPAEPADHGRAMSNRSPTPAEPAPAPPATAAPDAGKIEQIADPIARQRASLQMSAQRAAIAQREKQAAEEAAKGKSRAPSGGEKSKAASGWGRLMVRGVVLALAVGAGAGAVNTLVPAGTSLTMAALKPDVSPAALNANDRLQAEQTLANVTGEINQPAETVNSSVSAVINADAPKPAAMTGILIQDQAPQAGAAAAQVRQPGETAASGALKVSAASSEIANAADNDDQSKVTLGLPPVTVGPLSLRLAAGNGDPSAEFEVASRLAEGKGTDQNLGLATRWYQRSASKGFVQAQYRLGTLYERGLGVTKDLNRAKVWYQRAAEQGHVKSMHNLAVLAAGRSGSAPDYATAVKWFTSAAQNGLADSQFNLAVLTESGLGAPKDKIAAFQWYTIAARSGDREAIRRRDALRTQLTKAELASADAFIAQWQPLVPDRLANDSTAAGQAWKARQTGSAAPDNG